MADDADSPAGAPGRGVPVMAEKGPRDPVDSEAMDQDGRSDQPPDEDGGYPGAPKSRRRSAA